MQSTLHSRKRMSIVAFLFLLVLQDFVQVEAVYVFASKLDYQIVEYPAPPSRSAEFDLLDKKLLLHVPVKNPAGENVCTDVIDVQYSDITQTYMINYWQRPQMDHAESVEGQASITDLQKFIVYARSLGVWDGDPDCDTIYERLLSKIIMPVYKRNLFLSTPNAMSVEENGLTTTFSCNGVVCTSEDIIRARQLSGGLIERVRRIYSIN